MYVWNTINKVFQEDINHWPQDNIILFIMWNQALSKGNTCMHNVDISCWNIYKSM